MRYRKRPLEVEAAQWFPGKDVPGVEAVKHWVTTIGDDGREDTVPVPHGEYYVITIHGQRAYLAPGDWVITEPDGEHHYPCKPDIFEATYEAVD